MDGCCTSGKCVWRRWHDETLLDVALDSLPCSSAERNVLRAGIYRVSDEQYRDGTYNMYHCTPCPRCKESYRVPTQDRRVECSDCGFTEPASEKCVDPYYLPGLYGGDR